MVSDNHGTGGKRAIKSMKMFYILAGANGSGKSTISKVLLPVEGVAYVNPDDIAKELNPGCITTAGRILRSWRMETARPA